MKTIDTPNNIEVLLHYYVCGFAPHPRAYAPAVREATDLFLRRRMIVKFPGGFEVTARGKRVIDNLCSVTLPPAPKV